MLVGEAQELFSERATRLLPDRTSKKYVFQIRNDDGLRHFRSISRTYPSLKFVLVYGSNGDDTYGSYSIFRGRARSYSVPATTVEDVMAKHGVLDDPDDEWSFLEAEMEIMDLAEARWQKFLIAGTAPD
jgi:hypothetical protein